MVFYDISHLNQPDHQCVVGPIQDDEALFLYSLIRVMRLKNIVEVGSGIGYSALNFIKAVGPNGKVVSIDIEPSIKKIAENHFVLIGDAKEVTAEQLNLECIDLIFFDCHNFYSQVKFYYNMLNSNLITQDTVLVMHDTGLHPKKYIPWSFPDKGGFVHQEVERKMVNFFVDLGYNAFCLHMSLSNNEIPFRHGLTVMSKFRKL